MKLDNLEKVMFTIRKIAEHGFYIGYYVLLIVMLITFYCGLVWAHEALFIRIEQFRLYILGVVLIAGLFSVFKVIVDSVNEARSERKASRKR